MSLDNFRVVLVEPLYGGNVGSVCRAMANMGFCDLALVTPRNLNMDEARKMALHAGDILDDRSEFNTLEEAVADCGAVMGATARKGLYRQHSKTPREWACAALEMAGASRVALVFGREDNGLSNEELAICTQLIQIPTANRYVSLNLAQAVMVCCYEMFVAQGTFEPTEEKSEHASTKMRERMFEMWRETLLLIDFMEEEKADHMMLGLRRVLSRGALTEDDVHIMMGIARQTKWAAKGTLPGKSRKLKDKAEG